jgi:hypothetical protein
MDGRVVGTSESQLRKRASSDNARIICVLSTLVEEIVQYFQKVLVFLRARSVRKMMCR